jgi:hypothetical protein
VIKKEAFRQFLPAALMLSVAFCIFSSGSVTTCAQDSKVNKRATQPEVAATPERTTLKSDGTIYGYEFSQPNFYVSHIVIEIDSTGEGKLTFERTNEGPAIEQLEISTSAVARITALYQALNFLDSNTTYQSERQFPHLGTVRLTMQRQGRKRTAEFNWTANKAAADLSNEFRKIADQALFVFDMQIARENQPLNAPKLLEGLETLVKRNGLSDPQQLVPLLKEISTDDHLPLIARNHAMRLLKRIAPDSLK